MNRTRVAGRVWRCLALVVFSVSLAWMVVACSVADDNSSSTPTAGTGTNGSAGTSAGGAGTTTAGTGTSSGGAIAGSGVGTSGAMTGGSPTAGTAGAGGLAGSGGSGGSGGVAAAGSGPNGGSSSGGSGGAPAVGRSAGCGKTSTVTFGAVPGESGTAVGIGAGGYVKIGNRGFAMRLPDNYDNNKPYWLIFGFHWNGGNSKEVDTGGTNGYNMSHFGLQKLSNNGAIFVAPDGLNAGWGGDNLGFVDDMVKLIQDNYCVDTTHLFANGFSYGGGMSYAIACARAKVFRGVAIYNGAVLSGCEGGTDPIAYWQMAGQTDNTCTIGAGRTMRDKFVKNNGCTAQSPPEPPQPPPYLATGGHVCTTYSGCSSGHPVRWCAHQSGHGNAIVDGTADLFHVCANPDRGCTDSCKCSWVPEDVWTFFKSL